MLLIKDRFQGVFLCFVLALPAYFLGKEFEIIGGPVFAILLGMLLSKFVREKDILKSGITFTSKKVLQYAVILLGFGLNLSTAIFAGTAVNDTSSVTAAASSWDSMHNTGTEVLTGATIVKLTRTLAIIPITLVLGFYQAKKLLVKIKLV
jgi:uncharacterized membrane protein YadS